MSKQVITVNGKEFSIVEKIAHGGQGVVYKALDCSGNLVAVKRINTIEENNMSNALIEAYILGKLSQLGQNKST